MPLVGRHPGAGGGAGPATPPRSRPLLTVALVVLLAAVLPVGCAEVAGEVAGELLGPCLEIAGRAACASLCDDDQDSDPPGEEGEAAPPPRTEPPPPEWQPAVADCELTRDDAGVHVDCAGGTRALFTTGVALATVAPGEARSPTVRGPVEIREPLDVGRLAGTRAIEGSLMISSRELVSLVAPELQSIGGDLVVTRAMALQRLELPALARVSGAVVISDNARLPQEQAEELVFGLTRHGFSGAVDVAGNAPTAP